MHRIESFRERIEPITAVDSTPMSDGVVRPGQVLGIHQVAEGDVDSRTVIALELEMAVGIGPSRDRVRLVGVPDLELDVPGGLHGDVATAAIVVNAIPRVLAAGPGLVTMADLAPPTPGPPRPGSEG